MILITSFMVILVATYGVKGTEEPWSDRVKAEIDHLNSEETNSTEKDEFRDADPNTEIEITTSNTGIARNNVINEPTWNSNENDDVDDETLLKSTVNQRTTTDDTSSFIEVEEQLASQAVKNQIYELSRKSIAKNKSSEATEDVFGKGDFNGTHNDVSSSETRNLVDSADDNSTNSEIIENTTEAPSWTTEVDDFAGIFKSNTEDIINNSPNPRRMLNEAELGKDFRTKTQSVIPVSDAPQIVSTPFIENLGQQLPIKNIDARTQLTTEASTFEPARLITPKVSLLPPDHLNQLSYSYAQSSNKPNPLGYQPKLLRKPQGQFDISAIDIPAFRIWNRRSTKPTLGQQIQPYIKALATSPSPPYQKYSPAQVDIMKKLQLATQALRMSIAKEYVDWYRRNIITFVNNVNKPQVFSY